MWRLSIPTEIFLWLLSFSELVLVLRGLTILAFLPGIVVWLLLLLTIGSGVVTSLQRIR